MLVVLAFVVGSASGAYSISMNELLQMLMGRRADTPAQLVFLNIRLPRLLLAMAAGAGLALGWRWPGR